MNNIYKVGVLFILLIPFWAHANDSTTSPITSFSISLVGNTWNLISIPVDVPDESVTGVLGDAVNSIDTIYMYDSNNWEVYNANHPELSTLTSIQPGYGYFVHTTSDATISGRGTLFSASSTPPTRQLVSGWNLIGVFEPQSSAPEDIDQVFSSIGFSGVDYLALWKLDPSNLRFTSPDRAQEGDAFWILLNSPHTYGPSNF